MISEDFSLLENIVEKNIAETSDPTKFDWKKFVSEMEKGFTELGFREKFTSGVENILLIRIGGGVGDHVLMSSAIRELRNNFPSARITLAVDKRIFVAMNKCPYVNEVLDYGKASIGGKTLTEYLRMAMNMSKKFFWKNRYKLCITFKGTSEWAGQIFEYMSGAQECINYIHHANRIYTNSLDKERANPSYHLLTNPILYPKKIIHEVERNLYLLKTYGLSIFNRNTEFWYDYSDLYQARNLINNFGEGKVKIVVGIGTSSSQPERKYPVEKYLAALKKIIEKGAAIVLLGGPSEVEDAKFLQENLPRESVLNLVEVPSGWHVDVAIMSLLDMYIGNFTGLCDAAAAVHLPIIWTSRDAKDREKKFNGVSQYYRFYPWQTHTIGIRPEHPIDDCKTYSKQFYHSSSCIRHGEAHCIKQISPEEIVAAYDKMVDFIKTAKKVTIPPLMKTRHSVANMCSVSKLKHQKNLPLLTDFEFESLNNFNFVSK